MKHKRGFMIDNALGNPTCERKSVYHYKRCNLYLMFSGVEILTTRSVFIIVWKKGDKGLNGNHYHFCNKC